MNSFAVAKNKFLTLAALLLAASTLIAGSAQNVSAAQQVQAQICDNISGSSISIIAPSTDSIVTALPIVVQGTVTNASQIDVTIDDVYDSTIPLSIDQAEFSYELNLNSGTHTVHFVTNDRCHLQNGSADLVLTYQANTTPSSGGMTETAVDPTVSGVQQAGGVQIGTQTGQPASSGISRLWIVLSEFVHPIGAALDLDTTLKDSTIQGVFRIVLIVSGAFMASVGSASYVSVLEFFRQNAQAARIKQYFTDRKRTRESIFRVTGLFIFILAFFI